MTDPKEELFKQLRSIDMANAKEELLGVLERVKGSIKCATINCGISHWYNDECVEDRKSIDLKEGYHVGEY